MGDSLNLRLSILFISSRTNAYMLDLCHISIHHIMATIAHVISFVILFHIFDPGGLATAYTIQLAPGEYEFEARMENLTCPTTVKVYGESAQLNTEPFMTPCQ